MYYVVGLGNPGDKYHNTRHNVGWLVLDRFVTACGLPQPFTSSKYAGRISEGVLDGKEIVLLYPDTYMNKSGRAVQKLVPKTEVANLIIVHDDIDLPVGEVKVSQDRGAGGHNGVASIINSMNNKGFIRVRVGVAGKTIFGNTKRPEGSRLPKYVLSEFKKREMSELDSALETAVVAVKTIILQGVVEAMNKINQT